MRFDVFALNKADEKKEEDEKEKLEERGKRKKKKKKEIARERIRTFKMRYFIVASLAVKRAPRASTVKKTKTTTLATATAMKRAVVPLVSRVCLKLHENPIVVCWLEAFVARQRRIKAESTKGLENYYNGKRGDRSRRRRRSNTRRRNLHLLPSTQSVH